MNLIDTKKLEKMALAKRIGQFLNAEQSPTEREEVERVACMLASDVSEQVRSILAFELRFCMTMPMDLAEKIARDVEDVSVPFLSETEIFDDAALSKLVPTLQEFARMTLAKRSNLGVKTQQAIVTTAQDKAVGYLMRNDRASVCEPAMDITVKRFSDNVTLMNQMSSRDDLPLSIVEKIIDLVSDCAREAMIGQYAVEGSVAEKLADTSKLDTLWERVSSSNNSQIHGFVSDLRRDKRLNALLALEMGERGSRQFIYSFFALGAGISIGELKGIFTLYSPEKFVDTMRLAGVSDRMGPRFLSLAKRWKIEDDASNQADKSGGVVILSR